MGTKQHPANPTTLDNEVIKDKSKLTLAQVISHIFEKSINIQYQEFQGKLSNSMKEFFFTSIENHHYSIDLKLSKFWN